MADPRIPDDLPMVVAQRRTVQGCGWLLKLPGLLDAAVERWDLELGESFRMGRQRGLLPYVGGTTATNPF